MTDLTRNRANSLSFLEVTALAAPVVQAIACEKQTTEVTVKLAANKAEAKGQGRQ